MHSTVERTWSFSIHWRASEAAAFFKRLRGAEQAEMAVSSSRFRRANSSVGAGMTRVVAKPTKELMQRLKLKGLAYPTPVSLAASRVRGNGP